MKLLDFLRLAAIIGPLPNIIKDGDLVDAVPVMNDFNWIVNQVNANIPPLIPSAANQIVYVPQAAVGGTGNAITLSPSTPITSYTEGQSFRFRAANTNSGAVTINTSGLGLRTVTTPAGAALTGGEITAGGEYDVVDTGTVYMLMNAQSTAFGTWTPGMTFGGLNVGMTFASQVGLWQKVNNMVYIAFQLQISNRGTSAGPAVITSLPQNINAGYGGNDATPIAAAFYGMASTPVSPGGVRCAVLLHGTNTLALQDIISNQTTRTNITNFDFAAGPISAVISGQGWYSC